MSNITLTDDLRNHVNAICAKSKAWAEAAPEGEFRGYSSYDEQDIIFYCEHYTKGERCLTPAEWDQTKAWEEYYDAHKSAYGIRPRWTNWQDESAEEWDRMSSDCYAQARADYELEQVKKEAEESYEYEAPAPIANGLDIA
jgi:hypothetical protein